MHQYENASKNNDSCAITITTDYSVFVVDIVISLRAIPSFRFSSELSLYQGYEHADYITLKLRFVRIHCAQFDRIDRTVTSSDNAFSLEMERAD